MAELSKAYEPQAVEAKWYARWLAASWFTADPASSKQAYSIVMPPPNVTGVLTLGQPASVPFRLDSLRFVSFGNYRHGEQSSKSAERLQTSSTTCRRHRR